MTTSPNPLLCWNNRADSATLSAGTYDATYVRNNLKDPDLSLYAQTSSAARANTRFRFDLTANYVLRALALAGTCNFSTAATWRARVGQAPLDLLPDVADERVTYAGGANGTVTDSSGSVVAAASNPRADYSAGSFVGALIEEARTNHFLNSTAPANQTSPGLATGSYTLSVSGTGSVAVAANTATITGAGTATAGNPVTFTVTVTGTVDYTVTGSPTRVQAEGGTFATSHIITAGSNVTRTVDTELVTGGNFTGWWSASGGTVYWEGSFLTTTGAGAMFEVNTDATNLVILWRDGTDFKADVLVGGVLVASLVKAGAAANTDHRVALRLQANNYALVVDGATAVTDTSGALPACTAAGIGTRPNGLTALPLNGRVKRCMFWPATVTISDANLQAITTSGPDIEAVGGYNSGLVNCKQMTFYGDTPSDWSTQYPTGISFDARTARYGTVDFVDTANSAGYLRMGRLFVGGGFQASAPAEGPSYTHPHEDLSTKTTAASGKDYGTSRRKRRMARFRLPVLTQAEADHLHEMRATQGKLGEILYIPNPTSAGHNQRYGGIFTLPPNLFTIEQRDTNTDGGQYAATIELQEKL